MLLFLLLAEGEAGGLVPRPQHPGQAGRVGHGHRRGVPGAQGGGAAAAAAAVGVALRAVEALLEQAVLAGARLSKLGLPFHTGTENTHF